MLNINPRRYALGDYLDSQDQTDYRHVSPRCLSFQHRNLVVVARALLRELEGVPSRAECPHANVLCDPTRVSDRRVESSACKIDILLCGPTVAYVIIERC